MKKVISAILVLCMVMCLVPVTFATDTEEKIEAVESTESGIKVVYDIGSYMGTWGDTSLLFKSLTYVLTNNFWQYAANSASVETIDNVNFKWRSGNGVQLLKSAWFAIKIKVPESGNYIPNVRYGKYKSGEAFDVYLFENPGTSEGSEVAIITAGLTEDNLLGTVKNTETMSSVTWSGSDGEVFIRSFGAEELKKAEYYLVYKHSAGSNAFPSDFTLYTVDSDGNEYETYSSAYMGIATVTDDELTVGETTTASATLTESMEGHTAITNFTYTSSNEAIATVEADGTVTAVGPGKATISATAAGYAAGSVIGAEVTVNAPTTDDTVSFSVAPSVSSATVTVEGITYDETVESVDRGTEVTLTANPLEDYTFIGWKRGSNDAENSYISTENPFTTTLYTNTYLTAVYAADTEEKAVVEYYNQNGDYIDTLAPEVASPTPGAIPGFTFTAGNWFIGENTKLDLSAVTKRTRAVAKHTAKSDAGTVTVEGTLSGTTAFDTPVTPVAEDGFTCWKRDGKVVSYDENYTYYIWDDTTIEQSNEALPEGDKLPIIILDNDKVDGAYMIEYDAADYEIVEVGLVFGDGNDGTPSVDSCKKKFTSQRKLSHGQMAAKYSDNVRGYLIYKDGDNYRVIYDSIDAQ